GACFFIYFSASFTARESVRPAGEAVPPICTPAGLECTNTTLPSAHSPRTIYTCPGPDMISPDLYSRTSEARRKEPQPFPAYSSARDAAFSTYPSPGHPLDVWSTLYTLHPTKPEQSRPYPRRYRYLR